MINQLHEEYENGKRYLPGFGLIRCLTLARFSLGRVLTDQRAEGVELGGLCEYGSLRKAGIALPG